MGRCAAVGRTQTQTRDRIAGGAYLEGIAESHIDVGGDGAGDDLRVRRQARGELPGRRSIEERDVLTDESGEEAKAEAESEPLVEDRKKRSANGSERGVGDRARGETDEIIHEYALRGALRDGGDALGCEVRDSRVSKCS